MIENSAAAAEQKVDLVTCESEVINQIGRKMYIIHRILWNIFGLFRFCLESVSTILAILNRGGISLGGMPTLDLQI